MATTPQLSNQQNARLRKAMRKWIDTPDTYREITEEHPKGVDVWRNASVLARALGLRQPTISEFIREKGGASYDTAKRFATFIGVDVDDLIGPDERDESTILAERGTIALNALRDVPGYMDALAEAVQLEPHWSPLVWEAVGRTKTAPGRTQVTAQDLLAAGQTMKRVETRLEKKGLVRPAPPPVAKTPYRRYMSDVRRIAGIGQQPPSGRQKLR